MGLDEILKSIEIQNLAIQLPMGLNATASDEGKYNASTGLLTYSNLVISDKGLQKKTHPICI